jgi:phage terminase large subunit GpA-like protein
VRTTSPSRKKLEVGPVTAPEGLQQLREIGRQTVRAYASPPPRLTVSEWADTKRMLSREYAAEPGQWRTSRAPYQRGIMDAFSDFAIEKVVVMSSAQVGKSEILFNVIGYFVDEDPSPILKVRPTTDDAEQWSKTRLAPTIRDTPVLRERFRDPKSRNSGNTLLIKEFPGGHLTIVGANAPTGLASKAVRVVLCDEVDRFPVSAGTEGDPVAIAEKRTTTFWNRKIGLFSTPTIKGASRIHTAFEEGDQRYFEVPCAACGFFQRLVWAQLRWEPDRPASAVYECVSCKTRIREREKLRMLQRGRWRATAVATGPIASFHLNALYSAWARWPELVREFLSSQADLQRLQAFTNTVWGEVWEDKGGGLDPEKLETRKEEYDVEVPAGVAMLTMGVDVQADRLEYLVRGWGAGEESWLVDHDVILGDPEIRRGMPHSPWDQLDQVRRQDWTTPSGKPMRIAATCVDSGYQTDAVYDYCRPLYGQRVFAVKGSSTPGRPIVPRRPSVNNKGKVRLFELGTEAAKDVIYSRLRMVIPGPQFMHLPTWTTGAYFEQITAERTKRRQVAGRWIRRYELPRGRRSETLDCEVYALAGLRLTPMSPVQIGTLVQEFGTPANAKPALVTDEDPAGNDDPPPPPRRRGWVNRWKP